MLCPFRKLGGIADGLQPGSSAAFNAVIVIDVLDVYNDERKIGLVLQLLSETSGYSLRVNLRFQFVRGCILCPLTNISILFWVPIRTLPVSLRTRPLLLRIRLSMHPEVCKQISQRALKEYCVLVVSSIEISIPDDRSG